MERAGAGPGTTSKHVGGRCRPALAPRLPLSAGHSPHPSLLPKFVSWSYRTWWGPSNSKLPSGTGTAWVKTRSLPRLWYVLRPVWRGALPSCCLSLIALAPLPLQTSLRRFIDGHEQDVCLMAQPSGKIYLRIAFEDASCLFGMPVADVCRREGGFPPCFGVSCKRDSKHTDFRRPTVTFLHPAFLSSPTPQAAPSPVLYRAASKKSRGGAWT